MLLSLQNETVNHYIGGMCYISERWMNVYEVLQCMISHDFDQKAAKEARSIRKYRAPVADDDIATCQGKAGYKRLISANPDDEICH